MCAGGVSRPVQIVHGKTVPHDPTPHIHVVSGGRRDGLPDAGWLGRARACSVWGSRHC